MFVGWVLIFAAAFVVFTLKDEFVALGNRLLLEAAAASVEHGAPGETPHPPGARRPFLGQCRGQWRDGALPGRQRRHHDQHLAATPPQRAGIEPRGGFPAMVQTANGTVMVERGRADTTRGRRRSSGEDVAVHISEAFGDMNVIGMNFLSSLVAAGASKGGP